MAALARIAVAASVLAGGAVMGVPAASAHSWYSGICCSDRDCRPVTAGEVELRPDGWYVVPAAALIPFGNDKIKLSEDINMHVCMSDRGNVGKPSVICLYIPDPGT